MTSATQPTPGRSRGRGLAGVGAATVISAVLGWLVLVVVARVLGPVDYAHFSVLWGLFFGLAGVLFGLQQEITRAVSSAAPSGGSSADAVPPGSLTTAKPEGHRFYPLVGAVIVGGVGGVVLIASSPLWGAGTIGDGWFPAVVVLAFGIVAQAGYSAVNGIFAAKQSWGAFAGMISGESAIRFAAVTVACLIGGKTFGLTAAIITGSVLWLVLLPRPGIRRLLIGSAPGSLAGFNRRALHAMTATGCSAVLVSGFPVLLKISSPEPLGATAGVLLAAILATRTPLLLPLNAYQSVALTYFVQRKDRALRAAAPVLGACVALGAVAALAAGLVGPWVLGLVFGQAFVVSGPVLAALTAASVCLAMLTMTGIALLAQDRHSIYTAGWLVATAVTIGLLYLPLGLETRAVAGLIGGPVVGMVVHLLALVRPSKPVRSG